jgi:hypothetical protein
VEPREEDPANAAGIRRSGAQPATRGAQVRQAVMGLGAATARVEWRWQWVCRAAAGDAVHRRETGKRKGGAKEEGDGQGKTGKRKGGAEESCGCEIK